jgi:hypothetical protein
MEKVLANLILLQQAQLQFEAIGSWYMAQVIRDLILADKELYERALK